MSYGNIAFGRGFWFLPPFLLAFPPCPPLGLVTAEERWPTGLRHCTRGFGHGGESLNYVSRWNLINGHEVQLVCAGDLENLFVASSAYLGRVKGARQHACEEP